MPHPYSASGVYHVVSGPAFRARGGGVLNHCHHLLKEHTSAVPCPVPGSPAPRFRLPDRADASSAGGI